MKNGRFAILGIVLAATLIAPAVFAYDDPDDASVGAKAKSSITSCRAYASSFRSQGPLQDKIDFQNRFGSPLDTNVSIDVEDDNINEYSFDALTKIVLECQGSVCRARCVSKF